MIFKANYGDIPADRGLQEEKYTFPGEVSKAEFLLLKKNGLGLTLAHGGSRVLIIMILNGYKISFRIPP